MSRPFLAILLALVVRTLGGPLAAHATTITVNTTADELNADGDCSLREAVQAANSNAAVDACAAGQSGQIDTIVVPAGTYTLTIAGSNDNNTGGDLDIREDVAITGAGAATTIVQSCDVDQLTADCPAGHGVAERVLNVIDANATISGVTIRHGRVVNDTAGGIYVRKFSAELSAGLTLTDAVVTKNATANTFAVATNGGGVATTNAALTLTRVTLSDNVAGGGGGNGGAIATAGDSSTLQMTDCTVSGNEAGNNGGGIYNDSNASAILTSSTLMGNHALLGSGGAFCNRLAATATLTNCTVSGNQSGGSFGGGIFNAGGTLNLRSCTVTLNHLGTGQGAGGIDADGTIVLRNTIVAGNIHDQTTPSLHSPDCDGDGSALTVVSEGHNLVGEALHCPSLVDGANGDQIGTQQAPIDPGLGPLGDNGGQTFTHLPLQNSLALDAGDPATPGSGGTACPATDQRGETRPGGIACDVGAVELTGVAVPIAVDSVRPTMGGNAGTTYTRVFGSGFLPGAVVRLVRNGFADVVGTTTDVRASVVTSTLDLTGVAAGIWSVRVENPDTSAATLSDAYTVVDGGGSDVWSALILPRAFVTGRSQTIYLQFGNRGINDARAVPLWLSFPEELVFNVPFPVSAPPAQAGQQATDWGRVAFDVPLPAPEDRDSFPLLLPIVPAGATMTLRMRVTSPLSADPSRLPFRVSADVGKPYFQPDLPAAIVAAYVERAKTYATAAHGTTVFPSDAAIEQYVRTQLAKIVADNTAATLANLGGDPIVFSQAQLLIDTGQFIAGESATAVATHDAPWLAWLASSFAVSEAEARLIDPDCDPRDESCAHEIPGCEDDPALCENPPIVPCDHLTKVDDTYVFRPCNPADNGDRPLRNSADPNDKVGPAALDDFIDGTTPMPYAISFENKPTATGDAYEVTITDHLDATKFDLDTFRLGPISFGSTVVAVPPDLQTYSTEVDLRPGVNILVGVDAALDKGTGIVTWKLKTLDPATHEFPENPTDGFLPPNVTQPQGEGAVLFTVNLKPGFQVGTPVCNQARIVFDFNEPIDTPDYCNTIGTPGGTPEDCGNCVDDDGDGLVDFEDPSCCADGGPTLALRHGLIKPADAQSRLMLTGTLTGTIPEATASGVALQLRAAGGGELLCARIPAASFKGKGKKAALFVDKKGTLAGAGGLTKILLKKTKKNVALALAGKRAAFATPTAGPLSVTVGFGDGTAAGQCAAVTPTFRAKKKGTIVAP